MKDLRRKLKKKLHQRPVPEACRGDYDLNPDWAPHTQAAAVLTPAAVLVPLIERAHGVTMLLTQRTHEMPTHAGQISFPGGRVQADDKTQIDAALREAEEEVGISPGDVTIAGYLDFYETRTRYRILPVVGIVSPDVTLKIDPREVIMCLRRHCPF